MKKEVLVLSVSGMIGSGFSEETFYRALEMKPDVVACDCGSTDSGPYSLGKGVCNKSRASIKRDIRLMLLGGMKNQVPVLIGSAGTAGGDLNLAWTLDIVREIAREEDLHFNLSIIHSEISRETLRKYWKDGKVKPLNPAPEITDAAIDEMAHIVGLMGTEPYIHAMEQGAQVVLAGRSSDVSIFAAVPCMMGLTEGPTWHAAKLLECGAACVELRQYPDCMMAWIGEDSFRIEPPNPIMKCTPVSCVSHALYETSNPFDQVEPGGILHIKDAVYEAVSDRAVRISGSRIEKTSQYTIRLEAARFLGYRQYVIAAVRDPLVIGQLDSFLDGAKAGAIRRMKQSLGLEYGKDFDFIIKVYGNSKNYAPDEICLLMQVVAKTEEDAAALGDIAWHSILHHPIPEWSGSQSNLAFPFSPPSVKGGEAYEFCLNHVVEVDDPLELFSFEYEQL